MKSAPLIFLFLTSIITHSFSQTTYTGIASILYHNCASCHRPSGSAPFSVLTFDEAYPWTSQIENVLNNGDMPPWGADTSYMHFVNERILSANDKTAILNWIQDGALEGDSNQLPPQPVFPNYALAGTPDLILDVPSFISNADTADAYNTVVINTGLADSRFVRAIELISSTPQLTHHIVINADTMGQFSNDFSGVNFTIKGDISLGGYQLGSNPIIFPNSPMLKMGVQIPAHADIILQVHTPKNTLGEPVQFQIRVYLYPIGESNVRPILTIVPLQYWGSDFWFLPEQIKTISTEFPPFLLPDFSLYSALPHSHQICTKILNYAYSGTDTIPLLKINRWDFKHQVYYYYQNLVKVPFGYKFHADHTYENTSLNPSNPFDPPQIITVGTNSTNEMLFDAFQVVLYQPGDEYINIDSILKHDPLISSSIKFLTNTTVPSFVFPNPLVDEASLSFDFKNRDPKNYTCELYTIAGVKVDMDYTTYKYGFKIKKGNHKSGKYIYQILEHNMIKTSGNFIIE